VQGELRLALWTTPPVVFSFVDSIASLDDANRSRSDDAARLTSFSLVMIMMMIPRALLSSSLGDDDDAVYDDIPGSSSVHIVIIFLIAKGWRSPPPVDRVDIFSLSYLFYVLHHDALTVCLVDFGAAGRFRDRAVSEKRELGAAGTSRARAVFEKIDQCKSWWTGSSYELTPRKGGSRGRDHRTAGSTNQVLIAVLPLGSGEN
jgi:hypothetical protein